MFGQFRSFQLDAPDAMRWDRGEPGTGRTAFIEPESDKMADSASDKDPGVSDKAAVWCRGARFHERRYP